MEVDEGSDQKSDIWPHWKAAHARLKNECTEDEKGHSLKRRLSYCRHRSKDDKEDALRVISKSVVHFRTVQVSFKSGTTES